MFIQRQSQQFTQQYRNHLEKQYSQPIGGQVRKKIQNYSFLITDKIGKGYSSVVYKGTNDLTGQTVAIKVIQLKSLRDQTSKFMLQTQIQCFKETHHNNLLRYQNSFFTVNNCYIITQYCQGGDLAKIIKENSGLNEEQAADMFYHIYQGYQHLYNAGFIHRDIKPANIFVSKNSPKIADFGFSKRRNPIQKQNYNVGTPIYMPKESLAANIYNQKTDVWALGITLYQMVFGYVPYKGKTEQDLRAEIQRGILKFPDNKPISQDLKNFISCCLDNDSFRRISVKEMHQHPWIIKLERKAKIPLLSIERNVLLTNNFVKTQQEQKQMRISLPNDGVSQNKSKQYFQQLPNALQNRRSISSMQKLKLCHPKKTSQILNLQRHPLCNRSVGSINLPIPLNKKQQSHQFNNKLYTRDTSQNKQNQPSNRASLSISTLPSTNNLRGTISLNKKHEKLSIMQEDNNRTKVGIQKIVSLINYFRLLYKIVQKIKQAYEQIYDSDIKNQLSKLNTAVIKDLNRNINLHLECLDTKKNLYKLNYLFWNDFIVSERWQMYNFVIKKYQIKYQSVLKSQQTQNNDQFYNWRTYFLDFYCKIKQMQVRTTLIGKQRYVLCQLSYYLQTLVQMDDFILQLGWEDFTQKYTSSDDFFLEGFNINITNFNEVDEKVKNKYSTIKKKQL